MISRVASKREKTVLRRVETVPGLMEEVTGQDCTKEVKRTTATTEFFFRSVIDSGVVPNKLLFFRENNGGLRCDDGGFGCNDRKATEVVLFAGLQ